LTGRKSATEGKQTPKHLFFIRHLCLRIVEPAFPADLDLCGKFAVFFSSAHDAGQFNPIPDRRFNFLAVITYGKQVLTLRQDDQTTVVIFDISAFCQGNPATGKLFCPFSNPFVFSGNWWLF
jgi:hypothetical protein